MKDFPHNDLQISQGRVWSTRCEERPYRPDIYDGQQTPMPTSKLARIAFGWGQAWLLGLGCHTSDRPLDSPQEQGEYLENPQAYQADIVDSGKLSKGKGITLIAAIILHI